MMGIVASVINWLSLPGALVILFALALSVMALFWATSTGTTAARRRVRRARRRERRQARRSRRRGQRAREIITRYRWREEEDDSHQ